MKNVHITIGHNVNGQPKHDTPAVCGMVSEVLGLEAFTAFECFGMWRGEAERSTRIEVCGLTDEEARQESVRCLRCDHFGYGAFRGGRIFEW